MSLTLPAAVEAVTDGQVGFAAWANSVQALVNAIRDHLQVTAPLVAIKMANQSVASETLTDDTQLQVTGFAGATYSGFVTLLYSGDTTGDIKFRLASTATCDISWAPARIPSATTTTTGVTLDWGGERLTGVTTTTTVHSAAMGAIALVIAPVTWTPATDGILKVQFARNTASATPVQMVTGSTVRIERAT